MRLARMLALRRISAAVRATRWLPSIGADRVSVMRALSSSGSADRELRVDMLQDDLQGEIRR